MFGNSTIIGHSERPSKEKDVTERDLGSIFIPPGSDKVLFANEKGPFSVVFDMEVIIDSDPLIFVWVRFGHLIDECFVFLSGEMIAREEVEHDLNFDNWIRFWWFDQPEFKQDFAINRVKRKKRTNFN